MVRFVRKCVWLCGCLLAVSPLIAQTSPKDSIAAVLHSLTARAGSVFAGEVVAVRPGGGVVEVEFRVNRNLKGSNSGKVILREWAGLWAGVQPRYRVGERAVVFLHTPGVSQFSSAVDGMNGVLPITPDLAPGTVSALSVDVRRLVTTVARDAGAPLTVLPERISLEEVAATVAAETAMPPGTDLVTVPPPARSSAASRPTRLPLPGGSPSIPVVSFPRPAVSMQLVQMPEDLGLDLDLEHPLLRRNDTAGEGSADGR